MNFEAFKSALDTIAAAKEATANLAEYQATHMPDRTQIIEKLRDEFKAVAANNVSGNISAARTAASEFVDRGTLTFSASKFRFAPVEEDLENLADMIIGSAKGIKAVKGYAKKVAGMKADMAGLISAARDAKDTVRKTEMLASSWTTIQQRYSDPVTPHGTALLNSDPLRAAYEHFNIGRAISPRGRRPEIAVEFDQGYMVTKAHAPQKERFLDSALERFLNRGK